MAINKVIYGGTTLIDLSGDSLASASQLMQGVTAHDRTGALITGTATGGGGTGGNVWQDQDGYVHLDDEAPSGQITVESLSVTQNGTYTAPTGKAYSPVSVNVSGGGGQYAWFGSGAEKVGTVINRTINLQNDTDYDSWTASTTATTLIAADASPYYSVSLNFEDYDYCFVTKGYVEPVYVSGTPMTSTIKRSCQYHLAYFYGYPNNSSTAAIEANSVTNIGTVTSSTTCFIMYFYNNVGTIVARSATQSGPIYMSSFPTVTYTQNQLTDGEGTMTYSFPAFYAKCDTSRFTTTRKEQVDSANTNYYVTVDLYRVPRGNSLVSHLVSEMMADLNAV